MGKSAHGMPHARYKSPAARGATEVVIAGVGEEGRVTCHVKKISSIFHFIAKHISIRHTLLQGVVFSVFSDLALILFTHCLIIKHRNHHDLRRSGRCPFFLDSDRRRAEEEEEDDNGEDEAYQL